MQGLLGEHGRLAGFRPLPDDLARIFQSHEPHAAMEEAEQWCLSRGFSMGPIAKGSPRGLKRGLHIIPHWTCLGARERAWLDGAIIAHSVERGPVVVRVRKRAADIGLLSPTG